MGRELQKRKNRSSTAKVRQNTKSKKKLLQNPIIAANWNQKETLSQNYRRLGLVSKLNHPTGGVERSVKILDEVAAGNAPEPTPDNLNISTKLPTTINISEARIERDPETGAILRVIDDAKANPLNDPLNAVEDNEDEGWQGFVNEHGLVDGVAPSSGGGKTSVVQQLEERAQHGVKKAPRKQSEREEQWVRDLVNKHGDDYLKMARDMKLNPMQQSVGDLKKRVKKWRASHGA